MSEDQITRTRVTYDVVAAKFLENTRDRSANRAALDAFSSQLQAGSLVLDVGAGPGADSHALRERRLEVVGVDLSVGMLRIGEREFPGPRVQADLRRLPFGSSSVDGAWAKASLLHLSPAEVNTALREIHRVLRSSAPLHLSVKQGEGSEWESNRYGKPRWFQYWSAHDLDALLGSAGFAISSSATRETRSATWLLRLACRSD